MVQVALMMLAAAVPLMAQAFDPDLRLRLQEAVVAARETHNIVGVSAAVVMDGELATFCAGMSHEAVPIDDQMVFGIGSNTKTLTAAAMMRLQDRGVLSIDDAIGTYLPPLAHVDPEITIRQLLNHTSGLGDYATGPTYADSIRQDPTRVWKRDELVTMIPPSQAAPGAVFDYCNTNYLLVGMIIERVTGQPLQDVLSIQPMQVFPDTPISGVLAHRWMGGPMGRQDFSATPMQSEWSSDRSRPGSRPVVRRSVFRPAHDGCRSYRDDYGDEFLGIRTWHFASAFGRCANHRPWGTDPWLLVHRCARAIAPSVGRGPDELPAMQCPGSSRYDHPGVAC